MRGMRSAMQTMLVLGVVLGVMEAASASVVVNPINAGVDGVSHGDGYAFDNAVANPTPPPDYLPGDGSGDGAVVNQGNAGTIRAFLGQRNDDNSNFHRLERPMYRFDLPALGGGQTLASATLRLYLESRSAGIDYNATVYHSQADNTRPVVGAPVYDDPSYSAVGDIATPSTTVGQYVTIDVTSQVLSDYANDGTLVAAFRIQADGLTYDDSKPTQLYQFIVSRTGYESQWPELVLEFTAIPEPASVMGVLAAGAVMLGRRRS